MSESGEIASTRILSQVSPLEPADERALLKEASRGSRDALESLVRRYWPDAQRVALGIVGDPATAEDVAQEAILAAIDNLGRFDRRRRFSPWLYRITTNKSLDHLRRRARWAEESIDDAWELGCEDPALSFVAEGLEPLLAIEPRGRAALVLRHLVGLSSKEIADVLEMKPSSARSLISRSLAQLNAQTKESG